MSQSPQSRPVHRRSLAWAARRAPAVLCGLALHAATGASQAQSDPLSLSLEQLMEVKVVGAARYEQRQSEVAAAVSVITRQEIQAFGWSTIEQALASLPGIHTTYDRQYQYLGTRGFSVPGDYTTRVLLTVNGNRLNDPLYDGAPAGRQLPLDMALVERIEFIPGPGGAVYGQNAMFGVVNVVTRRGADLDGGRLALAGESGHRLREGRLSWGRRLTGGVDLLLSASAMRARGKDRFFEFGDAGVGGVAAGLDGERDRELFARAAGAGWAAEVVHGDRRKDDPTGVYLSDPLVAGQYQRDAYTTAQFEWQHRLSPALELTTRLFAGRYRFDSELSYEGSLMGFPGRGDWQGLDLRLLATAWAGHKLMLGLEAQRSPHQDQDLLTPDDPAANRYIPSSGSRVGLYLQDEWRAGDSLLLTLGLRVDRNSVTGVKTSPRVAAIWQPGPSTTLRALHGRAHRAPNAFERLYDDGLSQVANPALGGERIDTSELVADHRVGASLLLRASLYRWSLRDLVTLGIDPVSTLPQYRSGQPVQARGLELSADHSGARGLRLRGSVSLQDVEDRDGRRLVNSPRLLGKLALSTPLPWAGWHLGYELQTEGRRLTLDGQALGGHAVSSLHLSTEALAPGLHLGLRVGNLFDRRYRHPGADTNWQNDFEQDGRTLRLTLAVAF